jgi:hypothetical protein
LRLYLYAAKLSVILNPVKNVTLTLFVGFLVNVFPMVSFVLVYEKVSSS